VLIKYFNKTGRPTKTLGAWIYRNITKLKKIMWNGPGTKDIPHFPAFAWRD
jgi:hypothetical protein